MADLFKDISDGFFMSNKVHIERRLDISSKASKLERLINDIQEWEGLYDDMTTKLEEWRGSVIPHSTRQRNQPATFRPCKAGTTPYGRSQSLGRLRT